MSKVSDFIDTLDLPVDGTYRCNCPVCHGKNTFTVTNDKGNVLYNCYKNSCRISGVSHTNMDAFTIKALLSSTGAGSDNNFESVVNEEFKLPPYLTSILPEVNDVNIFITKWNINPSDVYYDVRQDRVVFPVWHNGIIVDAVGRSVANRQPKWLRYASSPIPYMHGEGDVFVVVEDAISAYTVGELFPNVVGCALLGTQLTDFHKWFFNKYVRYNKFIVALDKDARDKTIKIVKELRANISNVSGLNLNDDLKYMQSEDLDNLQEMLHGRS